MATDSIKKLKVFNSWSENWGEYRLNNIIWGPINSEKKLRHKLFHEGPRHSESFEESDDGICIVKVDNEYYRIVQYDGIKITVKPMQDDEVVLLSYDPLNETEKQLYKVAQENQNGQLSNY